MWWNYNNKTQNQHLVAQKWTAVLCFVMFVSFMFSLVICISCFKLKSLMSSLDLHFLYYFALTSALSLSYFVCFPTCAIVYPAPDSFHLFPLICINSSGLPLSCASLSCSMWWLHIKDISKILSVYCFFFMFSGLEPLSSSWVIFVCTLILPVSVFCYFSSHLWVLLFGD